VSGLALGLLLLSILQVLYVRFFPPLTTLTMLERQREAASQGKTTELRRTWVDLEQVSPELIRAVLVGEDDHFYRHHGFDFDQIRKAWNSNRHGRKIRGASTITQQAARNLFLWQGRSWLRKGLEAYYTVLLELLVPKQRILELYLNVAEWGDRIFGIEAASQRYFKKPAKALNRTEAAALSASLPNPRRYPPTGSTRFQRRRQALILKRMNQPLDTGPGRVPDDEAQDDSSDAAPPPLKPGMMTAAPDRAAAEGGAASPHTESHDASPVTRPSLSGSASEGEVPSPTSHEAPSSAAPFNGEAPPR
jgi:monofunctional biosynthetic peptidoglycan transglycosylase